MFTAIKQVDEHVKRLLNISRNSEDTDIQCQTIAKLYFDVQEYGIAKNYIERYMKAKSNSESGYLLKAKIHENLNEFDYAFQCYDNLYNIYKRKNYITKACETLLKSNIGDKYAKMWIEILEKEIPDCDLLMKMKSQFFGSIVYTKERMDKLEFQMKNDKNNNFKREYLLILERNDLSLNALSKCIELINSYDILDDINAVRSCVKIFSNDVKSEDGFNKPLYCILLMALLKNRIKSSDYDCAEYLSKLYDLLNSDNRSNLMKQLQIQFLYYLITFAHELAIENKLLTQDITESLYYGYTNLISNDVYTFDNQLCQHAFKWLDRQILCRKSILNHMINNVNFVPNDNYCDKWVDKIIKIVWQSKDKDFSEIKNILCSLKPNISVNADALICMDIQCYTHENTDFNLLIWQLMCYVDAFSAEEKYSINISSSTVSFLNLFLNKLFPKLPLQTLHDRCPENICKADLVTFLLGASLTYKNAQLSKGLPIPLECLKTFLFVSDSAEKWWRAACDFLLNNKRNTSIGAMREYFKRGLEIIQVTDNKTPAYVKFQLGRSLAKFAHQNENYREAIFERSISFLYSAIKSNEVKSSQKTCPTMSLVNKSFNRNGAFNSPFNLGQNIVLFDTFEVPDDVLLQWKFEAYLCYIDWKLKLESLGEEVNMYELQDFIESASSINSNHPNLDLLNSKISLSNALKITDTNMVEKFNHLISESTIYAKRCEDHFDFLEQSERDELEEMLQEQFAAIESAKESDYSLLNFSYVDESRNNNEKSSYSILNDTQTNLTFNNVYKLENDFVSLDLFNEQINERMDSCLQVVDDTDCLTRNNKHEINILKTKSSTQNQLISHLISKFENLNRKFDKFSSLEMNLENVSKENIIMKQEMKHLHEIIDELENKNIQLEVNYNKFRRSAKFQSVLEREIKVLKKALDSELSGVEEVVKGHLSHMDDMETRILDECLKKQKRSKLQVKSENTIKQTSGNGFDLSVFSRDKWECPTCYLNVDNNSLSCPACTTKKPGQTKSAVKSENIIKVSSGCGFDLSVFSRNKWECPTCYLNVDNNSLSCPACTTKKPGQEKSTVMNTGDIGLKEKTDLTQWKEEPLKIKFGFNSNQNSIPQEQQPFGKPCVGFSFGVPKINESETLPEVESDWKCECTTSNSHDTHQCIACGATRLEDDNDSDVIFVSEPYVTEEQKRRARLLLLPDHFYYFENLPDNENNTDSDREDASEVPQVVNEQERIENPEMFDAHYEPIVKLEQIYVITGEEGWNEEYSKQCKLFRFNNNAWAERGVGVMKIMTREDEKKSSRLVMRRDKVQKVCCNHYVTKTCPTFNPMGTNSLTSVCWYANDFADNSTASKEYFAIRFKTEADLNEFKTIIGDLQAEMED